MRPIAEVISNNFTKILDVLAHLGGRRHEFQTVDHS